jgi:hypothetical protein
MSYMTVRQSIEQMEPGRELAGTAHNRVHRIAPPSLPACER